MAETPLIDIVDVHKTLGGKRVLAGVNLSIGRGECVCVIGQSGTGKSVLLKNMLGLMMPDKGQILVEGKDITKATIPEWNEFRRRVGMVFQGSALFDSLTVGENVAFALQEHTDLSSRQIRKIVEEKLAIVDLPGVEGKMPGELSGGMRKRVGIARGLATDPEIMLFDEPTTGLDPVRAAEVDHLVLRLRDKLSKTVIVVTHDMASAYRIATRIAMLHDGVIRFLGTAAEVKGTQDPFVHQFVNGLIDGPIKSESTRTWQRDEGGAPLVGGAGKGAN